MSKLKLGIFIICTGLFTILVIGTVISAFHAEWSKATFLLLIASIMIEIIMVNLK